MVLVGYGPGCRLNWQQGVQRQDAHRLDHHQRDLRREEPLPLPLTTRLGPSSSPYQAHEPQSAALSRPPSPNPPTHPPPLVPTRPVRPTCPYRLLPCILRGANSSGGGSVPLTLCLHLQARSGFKRAKLADTTGGGGGGGSDEDFQLPRPPAPTDSKTGEKGSLPHHDGNYNETLPVHAQK